MIEKKNKLWLISDSHERHRELFTPEDIDVVIHAGDGANPRSPEFNEGPFRDFLDWYQALPIPRKIYSPGNHDSAFARMYIEPKEYPGVEFLVDAKTKIGNKLVYASPYTPSFGHGWVYNMDRDKLKYHWNSIPLDTSLLITHGPPFGHLDETAGEHVGCEALLKVIEEELYQLEAHVFGHIHTERGHLNAGIKEVNGVKFINASVVDLRYKMNNNGQIIFI